MNRRTARMIVIVTMTTYLFLISSVYGQYDFEKRLSDSFNKYIIRRSYDRTYNRNLLRLLYRTIVRERRDHQHMTDAGYGSRVQAGSKVANALIAHHVYGAFGPGRRKRGFFIPEVSYTNQAPF